MRRSCPWAEAERRPGVEVRFLPLPDECGGAVLERRPGRVWIIIDPRLSPVEQKCRLAHELIHLDRGSARCQWSPATWDDVIAREETHVDREAAQWLVQERELWIFVGDLTAAGEDVTARVIAEHFQVTKHLAKLALARIAQVRTDLGTVEAWVA